MVVSLLGVRPKAEGKLATHEKPKSTIPADNPEQDCVRRIRPLAASRSMTGRDRFGKVAVRLTAAPATRFIAAARERIDTVRR